MKHPIPICVVLLLSATLVACSAPIGALRHGLPRDLRHHHLLYRIGAAMGHAASH